MSGFQVPAAESSPAGKMILRLRLRCRRNDLVQQINEDARVKEIVRIMAFSRVGFHHEVIGLIH
jgi:hypothetical protein